MAPTSGTQIYGDLVLDAALNAAKHGSGKLSVKGDVLLTGTPEKTQTLRSTAADLLITGAKALHLTSAAGNLALTTSATLTVAGVNSTETFTGARTSTVSLGDSHACGGRYTIDAADGVELAANVVTLGRNGGATVNILGNLVVSGSTTTVNSIEMVVADNLITVNACPAVTGRCPGILMERHGADVAAGDAAVSTTTLSVAAGLDSTTCTVAAAGSAAKGWVIAFSEGDRRHATTVVAVEGGGLVTLLAKLPFAFGTATTVVRFFRTTASAFVYDELQRAFVLGYTASDRASAAPVIDQRADLLVANLTAQGMVACGDLATPGFGLLHELRLRDDARTPVGTGLRHRGAYEVIAESVEPTGACATWRIVKSSAASTSFIATGTSIESEDGDEKLQIAWPAGQGPQLFHETTRTGGVGVDIVYKVRFLACF